MKGQKTFVRGVSNFEDLKVLTDISELAKLHEHGRNDLRIEMVVVENEFLNPSDAVGAKKENL